MEELIKDFLVSQEQLIAKETTLNTVDMPSSSSTSTSIDRLDEQLTNMLDMLSSYKDVFSPLAVQMQNIEKETERVAMLTKRMLEPPLVEPPMMEPPMMEPLVTGFFETQSTYTIHSVSLDHAKCSILGPKRAAPNATRLTLRGYCSGRETYLTHTAFGWWYEDFHGMHPVISPVVQALTRALRCAMRRLIETLKSALNL